jgi:hypothetical protein
MQLLQFAATTHGVTAATLPLGVVTCNYDEVYARRAQAVPVRQTDTAAFDQVDHTVTVAGFRC